MFSFREVKLTNTFFFLPQLITRAAQTNSVATTADAFSNRGLATTKTIAETEATNLIALTHLAQPANSLVQITDAFLNLKSVTALMTAKTILPPMKLTNVALATLLVH